MGVHDETQGWGPWYLSEMEENGGDSN
jgi:hypothetical protein